MKLQNRQKIEGGRDQNWKEVDMGQRIIVKQVDQDN